MALNSIVFKNDFYKFKKLNKNLRRS